MAHQPMELMTILTYLLQAFFIIYGLMSITSAVTAVLPARFFRTQRRPQLWDAGLKVSILVPCRDEASVIEGTMEALCALEHAPHEVVIIDDNSTDGTAEVVETFLCSRGLPNFRLLRRAFSPSTKARALNHALRSVTGNVVVVLDADNVPCPDLVQQLLAHFSDPDTAAVQGTVATRSRLSLISQIVALERIAGFEVRMLAKERAGLNSQFGGTVAAVRRSALEQIGGFDEACLTEDTDLTIRLVLAGHRVRYARHAIAWEDSPPTLSSYIGQKVRWAQGHLSCLRTYFGRVLTDPVMPRVTKADTLFFLCYYLIHLMCGAAIAIGIANFLFASGGRVSGWLIALAFVAPFGEIIVGVAKRGEWWRLAYLPVMLFFYLVNIYCAWLAVARLALGRNAWVKTARTVTIASEAAAEADAA